jgi:hypothetical protein
MAEYLPAADWLLACTPWAARTGLAWRRVPPRELDRLWLEFRERFGWFWAERQRQQFNQAAANSHLGITLSWTGGGANDQNNLPDPTSTEKLLRSVLKRFTLDPNGEPG